MTRDNTSNAAWFEDLAPALSTLKNGGVLLYPSDTLWGLGCDATNAEAVQKIYRIKQRENAKSLITLVSGDAMLNKYVKAIPEMAWDIIDHASRPTTIIYPAASPMLATANTEDGSVAVRIVRSGFCHQLINKLGRPIVSTSANVSGRPSPHSFDDIESAITDAVDMACDPYHHPESGTQASVIIKLEMDGRISILRK